MTVRAEITLDGSLGAAGPVNLNNNTYLIDSTAGKLAGSNLFHSFGHFNLETGATAHFTDSSNSAIANVIGRVTGGEPSSIDGTIKSSIANADLYLINPAGMVFGPNAKLDVPGSFYASTAATLEFADDSPFSATTPDNAVLSSAAPVAFGFLDQGGDIQLQGSHLQSPTDQTIHISASNIAMADATLSSAGGELVLSAVGDHQNRLPLGNDTQQQTITATGNLILDNSYLSTTNNREERFGDVSLTGGDISLTNSLITTTTDNTARGGNIIAVANRLNMKGTWLDTTTYSEGSAGLIWLSADNLSLDFSWLTSSTAGNGGQYGIRIDSGDFSATNGANLSTWTTASGSGGDILVNASRSLSLSGMVSYYRTGIFANARQGSEGNASNITINAPLIQMSDSAGIRSQTSGSGDAGLIQITTDDLVATAGSHIWLTTSSNGNAGNLELKANHSVVFSGQDSLTDVYTGINASNYEGSSGNAGNLVIDAPIVHFNSGSQLSTATAGSGQGGIILIQNADEIILNGGSIESSTYTSGQGGGVFIDTAKLLIENKGYINASTFGSGNASGVLINASKQIDIRDGNLAEKWYSGIFAGSFLGSGNAGDIILITPDLSVTNRSVIDSSTSGTGNAGNLVLQADRITIDTAVLSSTTLGAGQGGTIEISSKNIDISGQGGITTLTAASGDAGKIAISATENMTISGAGSGVMASTHSLSTGDGGTIAITTPHLLLDDGALIDASSQGTGNNLGIYIRADQLAVRNGSIIESSTYRSGSAGGILIETQDMLVSGSKNYVFDGTPQKVPSRISVSTLGSGRAGDILIKGLPGVLADNISLDWGGVITASSSSDELDAGLAGNLYLFTKDLTLNHGSSIRAFSRSSVTAGFIGINAFDSSKTSERIFLPVGHKLNLLNGSEINVESLLGDAGNIEIYLATWAYLQNSKISTTAAGGTGGGGNILIDPQFVILDNSQIIANAVQGSGGNIDIITDFLLASTDSQITASSTFGLQGTVSIQSQYSNIASSIAVLPGNMLDVSDILREDCAAAKTNASSFTIAGRGNLPLIPDNYASPGFQSLQCGTGL